MVLGRVAALTLMEVCWVCTHLRTMPDIYHTACFVVFNQEVGDRGLMGLICEELLHNCSTMPRLGLCTRCNAVILTGQGLNMGEKPLLLVYGLHTTCQFCCSTAIVHFFTF